MKYKEKLNTIQGTFLLCGFMMPAMILMYTTAQPVHDDSVLYFILCTDVCGRLELQDHRGRFSCGCSVSGGCFLSIVMQPGQQLIKDYQRNRILAWLNPETYADAEAYQQLNSVMAIGSGQLWGKGLSILI